MDMISAIEALDALAQETRMKAFRLLVKSGPPGLPAGTISASLDVPHNTLSSHLGILQQAGLVSSTRQGRSIIYALNFEGTRALLAYLMQDCCRGAPEVCSPALDSVLSACCDPGQ